MMPIIELVFRMHIIPVIDLRDGLAVHARRGLRSRYRPVATRLCADPEPLAVLDAYLSLYPFPTVYVADLNSIQASGDNDAVTQRLQDAHPRIDFWLDAGSRTPARALPGPRPVLGSETGITPVELAGLRHRRPILSLDFDGADLIGDPELLRRPESWPEEIIVMRLDRVGSEDGPALELCREIRMLGGDGRRLYLAGGIRDALDVKRAGEAGASGLLVATALHAKTLDLGSVEFAALIPPYPD